MNTTVHTADLHVGAEVVLRSAGYGDYVDLQSVTSTAAELSGRIASVFYSPAHRMSEVTVEIAGLDDLVLWCGEDDTFTLTGNTAP